MVDKEEVERDIIRLVEYLNMLIEDYMNGIYTRDEFIKRVYRQMRVVEDKIREVAQG